MSKPTTDLTPLNIIRTETVLSKLPIHNLSKNSRVEIQIVRKNEHGRTELYWNVSANEKYGLPGQLAYKIDTIIINKRIDELGRPLPKLIRLGSLQQICRELGLRISGRTAAQLKKAILQNAFAAITARLTYKGNDGLERLLEAGFTRYSIIFTGERLPNGKKADAVYLVLNDPYWEVLNNAPERPLDYDYLKDLTPAAQRFYEIISYRVFPAIKYNHTQAKLLYSEFCLYSAQSRYYDYQHFRKQMYKIHKPHIDSGYIKGVEYRQTTDAGGKIDWQMIYTIGRKAVAEYKAFNGKIIDIAAVDGGQTSQSRGIKAAPSSAVKSKKKVAEVKKIAIESAPESSAALELVQSFHKQARGVDNYQPYRGSKEQSQAEALLATYGHEKAQAIISFAIAQARKTNFEMRTFGAIFQYVDDAVAEYERREQELARRRAQQEAQRQAVEQRLQALSKREYRALYEEAKKQILSDIPSLASHQESEMLQSLIKAEMASSLEERKRKKKQL